MTDEVVITQTDETATVLDIIQTVEVLEVSGGESEVIVVQEGQRGTAGLNGDGADITWDHVIEKPETYPPEPHQHETHDIINLVSSLNSIEGTISSGESMIDLTVLFENTIA